MNKKVIIGLIIIVVIAVISVLGYFVMLKVEQNKVENLIDEMFTNLKSGEDNSQKQEVLEEIKSSSNGENSTENSIDHVILFNKLNYSIIENKTNFNEASVIMDITNKDMKKILGNYLVRAFQLAFANAFTPTYSEEQMNEELANYLKEQIESDEIENITTNITLYLEKQDGKWIVKEESKKELINAILPGFVDAVNQINESANQFSQN